MSGVKLAGLILVLEGRFSAKWDNSARVRVPTVSAFLPGNSIFTLRANVHLGRPLVPPSLLPSACAREILKLTKLLVIMEKLRNYWFVIQDYRFLNPSVTNFTDNFWTRSFFMASENYFGVLKKKLTTEYFIEFLMLVGLCPKKIICLSISYIRPLLLKLVTCLILTSLEIV